MIKHNGKEILGGLDCAPGWKVPQNVAGMNARLSEYFREKNGENSRQAKERLKRSFFSVETRGRRPREKAPRSAAEMLGEKPAPVAAPKAKIPRRRFTAAQREQNDAMLKQRGVRLRQALDAAGWDFYGGSRRFAERLGWRQSRISQLLCGFCSGGLEEVMEALKIEPSWLRTGEGNMFRGTPIRPTREERQKALENRAASTMRERGTPKRTKAQRR